MILIILLTLIALLLTAFVVGSIAIGGATLVIIFADVIVCVALIAWVIKRLINKKK